jgi:hypothetical protein
MVLLIIILEGNTICLQIGWFRSRFLRWIKSVSQKDITRKLFGTNKSQNDIKCVFEFISCKLVLNEEENGIQSFLEKC